MIAYIHMPKTAGMTMIQVLRQTFGSRHCDVRVAAARESNYFGTFGPAELQTARRLYPRLLSMAGHTIRPHAGLEEVCGEIWYYTFLRNPVERCASQYQHAIRVGYPSTSFEKFIAQPAFRNWQTRQIAGVEDADRAIDVLQEKLRFVGLFERFDESLQLLGQACPHSLRLAYTRQNISPDTSIKQRLLADPRMRELLEQAHAEDWKLYRYVRDVLFPAQRKQFGGTCVCVSASETRRSLLDRARHFQSLCRCAAYRTTVLMTRKNDWNHTPEGSATLHHG